MAPVTVGLLGASGETGSSILEGLLEAGNFHIIALVRPSSISKPGNQKLKDRGIELRALDLTGSQFDLVSALTGIHTLISAIGPMDQLAQIPLATAAKTAGISRFVPCGFVTVMPVGIHLLRDQKEEVYNHTKRLGLPYTIVDVGWWYQIAFPALPSGKIDYAVAPVSQPIAGDGRVGSALTDLRDVGRYMAKIIVDERTVNQMVLVFNEIWSKNQIFDLLEKKSGEKLERKYASREVLEEQIRDAEEKLKNDPGNFALMLQKVGNQYLISWGIRGDNTPEYAKYLGYLTSKELYPDMPFIRFEDYVRELLDGKATPVYEDNKSNSWIEELKKKRQEAQSNS